MDSDDRSLFLGVCMVITGEGERGNSVPCRTRAGGMPAAQRIDQGSVTQTAEQRRINAGSTHGQARAGPEACGKLEVFRLEWLAVAGNGRVPGGQIPL